MILVKQFLQDQVVLTSPNAPQSPTLSIILPTYARCKEGLLERSLRCVLSQTYRDFELIVMDDGSTDGSSELIERLRQEDPRVVHVRHERNSGLPGLRVNEGIELARGRYIGFQFDDDLWRPDALKVLVNEADANPGAVVAGHAQMNSRLGKGTIPNVPVDLVTLTEDNRLANNSVLVPREMFDRYGLYDPHIGMRRLTDWDLWLRLIRHVPFVVIDKIISDVFESNAGAIGVTVPWDPALFRFFHSIPRNHLLTPQNWREYPVDSLQVGEVDITGELRRRLYEEQIVPFYFQRRHLLPQLGSFSATLPQTQRRTVLYTKRSHDVSNDVTVGHYDSLTNRRGSFKTYYQNLEEVRPGWSAETNLGLLMRTVEDEAVEMVEEALRTDRAIGLHLDDDLFTFHEYGPQFDYLAPGQPYYHNLRQIAVMSDAVLVTNNYIAESVRPQSPRVIPHNNTIPDEALPEVVHPRGAPLRIGYVGTGYRIEEFRKLWEAFRKISQEYGDRLYFEFWGLDVSVLPPLNSPVAYKPFTFSYARYLEELRTANFDLLLTPLLDTPRPRLAKSLIKYYETAAAGALGIFSDVPQYAALPEGLTCLKADNQPESWYGALKTAIEMDPAEFDRMRARCLEHVRLEYSASAQVDLHEAALRAIEFHSRTRAKRGADGRPRVMYVLHSAHYGGAEIQLWRRLDLARCYGIQPVVVIPGVLKDTDSGIRMKEDLTAQGIDLEAVEYTCFTEPRSPSEFSSPLEREQVRALLERVNPVLVHTVTFIPTFGQICQEMKIPLVATLYAVQDDFAWEKGYPDFTHASVVQSDCLRYARRWSELLAAPGICARDMAPEALFDLGWRRFLEGLGVPAQKPDRPLRMVLTGTFQERKQQLETIEAAGRLKKEGLDFRLDFYGYSHFFPDYLKSCQRAIADWDLADRVTIHDFTDDLEGVLGEADILLSLSTYESFPGSIKDALAAGILVVATPAGGVAELIIDGISGLMCRGTGVDDLVDGMRRALNLDAETHRRIAEQGRRIARLELHPQRAANDIFRMYNLALERGQGVQPGMALQPVARIERSARAKMRQPSGSPLSLMPIGAGVSYTLAVDASSWIGLDVLVEPFTRPLSGQLALKVFTRDGDLLRTAQADVTRLHEGSWVQLRFDPLNNSLGQTFRIELALINASPGAVMSLRQASPPNPRPVRLLYRILRKAGLRLPGGALFCRQWYAAEVRHSQ